MYTASLARLGGSSQALPWGRPYLVGPSRLAWRCWRRWAPPSCSVHRVRQPLLLSAKQGGDRRWSGRSSPSGEFVRGRRDGEGVKKQREREREGGRERDGGERQSGARPTSRHSCPPPISISRLCNLIANAGPNKRHHVVVVLWPPVAIHVQGQTRTAVALLCRPRFTRSTRREQSVPTPRPYKLQPG